MHDPGLLSNQGEKSINFFHNGSFKKKYKLLFHNGSFKKKYKLLFHNGSFKKKGLQRGTPKPRISGFRRPAERNVISLGFVTPKWEFPKIGGTLFGRSS